MFTLGPSGPVGGAWQMAGDGAVPGLESDGTDVDRDLLAKVRAGDDAAFGELYSRHAEAVRRFSLRHVREAVEAEDLVAEVFFRVLQAVRRGSGPNDHVRAYLLTAARHVAWEWSGRRRDVPVDDEELSRRVAPYGDNTAMRAEYTLIGQAFTSLPERWRTVLWQVEVEGERPAAVAPHFGLSPNAMSALARRAREGLRAAYLQAHLAEDTGSRSCSAVRSKLGNYTAGGVQGTEQHRIRKHLQTCTSCNALHAELTEVCSTLRAHAGLLAVPVVATVLVGTQLATSLAAVGKVALLTARIKLALAAAASTTAVGLFGLLAGTFTGAPGLALIQPDQNAKHGDELTLYTTTTIGTATSADRREHTVMPPVVHPAHRQTSSTSSSVVVTGQRTPKPATTRASPIAVDQPSAVPPTTTSDGMANYDSTTMNPPTTDKGVLVTSSTATATTVVIYPTPRAGRQAA